jgi:hypothetical protein
MPYNISTYSGDAEHTICCTGDAVTGDEVAFERATFTGSFRKPKFAGFELIVGRIVADSYGAGKQQHTFTIETADGGKLLIKGRNLYREGVWRKPWADESLRHAAADDKHARGDRARALRTERKEEAFNARY